MNEQPFVHRRGLSLIFMMLALALPQSLLAQEINQPLSEYLNSSLQQSDAMFRLNQGQWNNEINFTSEIQGTRIAFLKNGLAYSRIKRQALPLNPSSGRDLYEIPTTETMVWKQNFIGANPNTKIVGLGKERSKVNYLKGPKENWVRGALDYKKVIYENLYPSINLQYFKSEGNLKYDFVLNPGAELESIKVAFEGINSLKVNQKGQLEIETPWGVVMEEKPFSYQWIEGKRVEVPINYKILSGNTWGFECEVEYNRNEVLILDPFSLVWSTFIGGSGDGDGYCYDLSTDTLNHPFVTGYYNSGFPTTAGVYSESSPGAADVFVTKFLRDGSGLAYSTYLGGALADVGRGISVNDKGEAFITGYTSSSDFPATTGAYQTSFIDGLQGFVCRLNRTGTDLVYSTFLGGTNFEELNEMVIDEDNNAYIVGTTSSNDFPTTLDAFSTSRTGDLDAVMAKISADGSSLLYGSYIGGADNDYGNGICLGADGSVIIVGNTYSIDFPTTEGAFQNSKSDSLTSDAFVVRFEADLNKVKKSTCIGGPSHRDEFYDVKEGSTGSLFCIGASWALDFPVTEGVLQRNLLGVTDGVVVCLDSSFSNLDYSTYLGGDGMEIFYGITLTSQDEALVAGFSTSEDFPVSVTAFQDENEGLSDVVVFELNKTATGFGDGGSTYLGGYHADYSLTGIEILEGSCEKGFVCNATSHSSDFPTTSGAYQEVKLNGEHDQPVVFEFGLDNFPVYPNLGITETVCPGEVFELDVYHEIYESYLWQDGSTGSSFNAEEKGWYWVQTKDSCSTKRDSFYLNVKPALLEPISVDTTICFGESINLTIDDTIAESFLWSTGGITNEIEVSEPGVYILARTNDCGTSFDTIRVMVIQEIEINLPTVPLLCNGETVLLDVQDSLADSYLWSNGEAGSSIEVEEPGTYWVELTNACGTFRDSVVVETNNSPEIYLSATDPSICIGETGFIDADASNGAEIVWSNGSTEKEIEIEKPGTYWVMATNDCGETTDSATFTFVDCCEPGVPNAFSPNYDGLNDEFHLLSRHCDIEDFQLRIFNRLGQLVFQSNDIDARWDGTLKGKEQELGVYVYTISYSREEPETGERLNRLLDGNLTLLR